MSLLSGLIQNIRQGAEVFTSPQARQEVREGLTILGQEAVEKRKEKRNKILRPGFIEQFKALGGLFELGREVIAEKAAPIVQPAGRFLAGIPSDKELSERFKVKIDKGKKEEQSLVEVKTELIKEMEKLIGFGQTAPKIELSVEEGKIKSDITQPAVVIPFGITGDVTKRLGRLVLNKIAKSTNFDEILKIIKNKAPEISDSLARTLSKRFRNITDPKIIAREFSTRVTREIGEKTIRQITKIPKELEPLVKEVEKFTNAKEFIESRVKITKNIKHLDPSEYDNFTAFVRDIERLNKSRNVRAIDEIETAQRLWGKKPQQVISEIKVKDVVLAEKSLTVKPKLGKKITEPIIIEVIDGKSILVDGRHRLDQAIANKQETIPAIISAKSRIKELTDLFNQVKGVKEIIKKVPTITAETPVPKSRAVIPPEAIEVSNASKIDPELGKIFRKDPTQTPNYIAMRIMKDGREIPAIRKDSGVFAPKEFELFDFKPLKGLVTGDRGVSFNFRDAAFSIDGISARQASKRGGFGPMVQMWYKHEQSLANRFTYLGTKSATVSSLAQKNGVKINKETGELLFKALEGTIIKEPNNIIKLAREITDQVLNIAREEANVVRRELGKKEIGFLNNYAPHMQRVSFWRQMITDARTTIVDNFDFIIPNAKKNPHALPREGVLEDLETNAWKVIDSYLDNIANDIFVSPQIEQLKAIGSVFSGRGQFGMSKFLDDYVRNNLVGKPGQFDSFLGLTEGSKIRAGLSKINMARNIAALSFNIVWTAFVQPASIVLTAARGGGLTRGIQNIIKGFTKFAFSTERNLRVRNLPTLITKTEGASLGMTGAGDLDRLGGRIFKSKIESLNDVLSKLADGMEYWLTGGSMSTGYEEAAKLGLKGKNADIFANWLGGATQSQYNKEARALIMNNLSLRTGFPFSTYAFEVWRFAKTLIGKEGGMPLEKSERLNQGLMFMAGAYLYNQYLEKVTGRKIFTVGSGVPIVGGLIDEAIYRGRTALGLETGTRIGTGRAPIAPQEDINNFIKAFGNYVNDDNIRPLFKELTKWGMGFSGIPGASTLNRFIDGMMASTQGYMTTRKGEPAFIIEGADKYIAPLLGPYSTKAGKAYLNQQKAREEKEVRVRPIYEESQALLEEGLTKDAQRLVDNLSPVDWEIYQKIKRKDKAEQRVEGVRAMIPFVQEAEDLLEQGKDEEAQNIVDNLTEQEFNWYQGAKEKLEKLREAKDGVQPSFLDGEIIDDRTLIEIVFTYAEAIGSAPIDALKAIFEGETIRRVDNRTIIVFRFPFSESQAIRSEWADGRELNNLRLDHIIPLTLGGLNTKDNLQLIPIEIWRINTPIEIKLGELLRDNKIEKDKARQLILDFKQGRISESEITNILGNQ